MQEPARNTSLDALTPEFRSKLQKLIDAMKALGFDPVVFEAKRSLERQKWLYGVGRTHDKGKKPITWTMHSEHLTGNAADVISKKHGWNSVDFYTHLKAEAAEVGLHTIPQEGCHIQLKAP